MLRSFVLIAFASLVVASASAIVPASPASAASGEPKLLLLPIIVHSAEDPSYLRGGLADMLSARFERIGGIDLVREEDAEKGTSSLSEARTAARKAGADYVLFGSFTRFGKGASLDVQCAPTDGSDRQPLREIFVHSGSIGEIIPDLDELAGKVSRFARGENVNPGPASPGLAAAAAPSREIADLARRVAELEAAIDALKSGAGSAAAAAIGRVPQP